MGGVACNGWRFWSLAQDGARLAKVQAGEAKAGTPGRGNKGKNKNRVLRPMKSQEGTPEGQVRWFCAACLDDFLVEGSEEPEACPQGHRQEDMSEAALAVATVGNE